jgi:hypothetical protein
MRELEFRAWDKVRNRMLTSAKFVEFKVINGVLSAVNYDWSGKEQVLEVVQYTGLKDANGVKIFEGDIFYLCGGEDNPHVRVCFCTPRGAYVFFDSYDDYIEDICGYHLETMEIIGNIYETPELLK